MLVSLRGLLLLQRFSKEEHTAKEKSHLTRRLHFSPETTVFWYVLTNATLFIYRRFQPCFPTSHVSTQSRGTRQKNWHLLPAWVPAY